MMFCLRWFGSEDPVTLANIRQIPGITGVVSDLFDIPVGQVWPLARIDGLKRSIEDAGLDFAAIESIPVHEDIKLGRPGREEYIANYAESVRNAGKAGVTVVTYNFMPVFDWYRSDLNHANTDGSTCLAYKEAVVASLDPLTIGDTDMPAWAGDNAPGRLKSLLAAYKAVSPENLWANLAFFLKRVVPVARQCGVKLAIHPDDPPWPIFGLPRIITSETAMARVIEIVDSPANGLALCSGSLGAGRDNDIPRMVRRFGRRIHFAHLRNVRHMGAGRDFTEAPHPTCFGSLDMYEIMSAYHAVGFQGVMRPDHGRMIWGEQGKPGYGLYDRALGATYLFGLWEAIQRADGKLNQQSER